MVIDSSKVTFQTKIETSSETFTNGFKIYHHYLGPNIEYNDLYYFVPDVGMVKIYFNHYNLGPESRMLWQLKEYYLK